MGKDIFDRSTKYRSKKKYQLACYFSLAAKCYYDSFHVLVEIYGMHSLCDLAFWAIWMIWGTQYCKQSNSNRLPK